MLALAALNRWRWTPCISAAAANPQSAALALARLRRNALVETALGLAVLGVVGVLGITVPGVHAQVLWPFSHTIGWDSTVLPRRAVLATLIVAAGLIIVAAAAIRLRAYRLELVAGGSAMVAAAAVGALWLLKVPAHPTTYLQSPVPYSVTSIARGVPLYGEHCAACHGAFGYGDGPAAAALPARPPYLTSRLALRREGDLVWSLGHRTSGICMPAINWANEAQLWDLFNYLRALAYADVGRRLDAAVEPWRPVTAPDFTFQIGRGAQESLFEARGRHVVLLVLYSSPHSLQRLRALADSKVRLERLGVRVVAVPITSRDALPANVDGVDATMMANPDAHLAGVYSMFTRTLVDDRTATVDHLELLIDRQGYLRARSMPGREPGWTPEFSLFRQAVALNREKGRAPAPLRHGH
jgi:mono/diheme cytochrome c family protein